MISRSRQIGSVRVVVRCAPEFERQATWLLGVIERLDRDEAVVREGARVQLGWMMLYFRRWNEGLVVHVPDVSRNPFLDTTDDLSLAIRVLGEQNEIIRRLEVEGRTTSFQDKVVAARGALEQPNIYLERTANTPAGDSGWYVGALGEGGPPSDLEALYCYELLSRRPALMKVLALPPGYLVVFKGDQVDAVLDPSNVDAWRASQGSHAVH